MPVAPVFHLWKTFWTSSMAPTQAIEKAKSDKKFCLEMALTRIRGKLDKEGGASLTERQATSAKTEVQAALDAYKRVTTEYLIALHDDQDKRKQEMELFHKELDESEETLDRILEIVENYEVAKNSLAPSQQVKQNLLAAFKSKQDLTMKSISNMLTQLNNLSKEERVTSSTTAIRTHLKELGDALHLRARLRVRHRGHRWLDRQDCQG